VLVGHVHILGLGDVVGDVLVPVGEIDQIALFVRFVGFASDFDVRNLFLLAIYYG